MTEVRLMVRCEKNPNHAKVLALRTGPLGVMKLAGIRALMDVVGKTLCGRGELYIKKPGYRSPVGFCARCHGELNFTITEVEVEG